MASGGTTVQCTVQAFDSSGNLLTVSSLTAYIVSETSGASGSSYTYSNGNTVTASLTAPSGGATYAPAGSVAQSGVAKLAMYLTYTGSAYDQPPAAPANLSPANNSTVSSILPTFSGSFSDPTSGDYLAQYEIAVNSAAAGGGSQVWDSGTVTASISERNNAQFSRGSAVGLSYGTTYSWRARVANQNGNWSPWCAWTTFTVAQAPNPPQVSKPVGLVNTATPAWSFTYSSPQGTAMASYHYTITDQGSGALVYDNGSVAQSLANNATLSGTISSSAGLVSGANYYFNLTVTDTNGATSSASQEPFETAQLPTAAPTSPVGGASVTTQTPTFTWSFSDPNYAQASYEVVVTNTTTGATLWDSGQTTGSTQSVVCGVSIPWNTHISWQVQAWDTGGLASGYSAAATAYVNNGPTCAVTSPTNNSTITTNTPTVTWTYTASAGGQAQASATVTVLDSHGNALATYTSSGAGTSYTLPAGVLTNSTTYEVSVTVTDTNAVSGTSAAVTVTVSYTPPADMQGQSLVAAVNYCVSPYLNTDSNGDGVADGWSGGTSGNALAAAFSVDASVPQGVPLASGDGFVTGAQKIAITGNSSVTSALAPLPAAGLPLAPLPSGSPGVSQGTAGFAEVYSGAIACATAGWTAGSTVLSAKASVLVAPTGGAALTASVGLDFYSGGTLLSSTNGPRQGATGGQSVVLLGPQGVLIPASTTAVVLTLKARQTSVSDTGTVWVFGAQLEAASASDATFIAGDMGTGYSYDANGFSHRAQVAGGAPTLAATPGANSDPLGAPGGTLTLAWDSTLANASGFYAYLIERRRMDQQTDDTAWTLLATITNSQQGSYTDYAAGSTTVYQYSVRQQITYPDGSTGVSAHRAIVAGAVDFSPAWYLTSTAGTILNLRLTTLKTSRTLVWHERAVYSAFLGRVGTARDAGPAAGYTYALDASYNATWGDNLAAVRRLFVQLQQSGGTFLLKDPDGLVVPVTVGSITFAQNDSRSDTLQAVSLTCTQAGDTEDY